MKVECPRCHTHVEKPASGNPVCPTCGFGAGAGTPPPTYGAPAAAGGAADPDMPAAAPAYGDPPAAGASWAPSGPEADWQGGPRKELNQTMAIVALVLGIVGCCIIPVLPSIAAIIVGAMAMKKVKDQPDVYGGNGMALAGVILGVLGVIIGIIGLILMIAGFASIPPECWDDPESPACDEALGEPQSGAPAQYTTSPPLAAAPLFFARPRPWHAG